MDKETKEQLDELRNRINYIAIILTKLAEKENIECVEIAKQYQEIEKFLKS